MAKPISKRKQRTYIGWLTHDAAASSNREPISFFMGVKPELEASTWRATNISIRITTWTKRDFLLAYDVADLPTIGSCEEVRIEL